MVGSPEGRGRFAKVFGTHRLECQAVEATIPAVEVVVAPKLAFGKHWAKFARPGSHWIEPLHCPRVSSNNSPRNKALQAATTASRSAGASSAVRPLRSSSCTGGGKSVPHGVAWIVRLFAVSDKLAAELFPIAPKSATVKAPSEPAAMASGLNGRKDLPSSALRTRRLQRIRPRVLPRSATAIMRQIRCDELPRLDNRFRFRCKTPGRIRNDVVELLHQKRG